MEEEYEWKPDVVKLESELILGDDENNHYSTGSIDESSSSRQWTSFPRSRTSRWFESPDQDATCTIPNAVFMKLTPIVFLERLNLRKIPGFVPVPSSVIDGLPSAWIQIKVEKIEVEEEDPLAGSVPDEKWHAPSYAASSQVFNENATVSPDESAIGQKNNLREKSLSLGKHTISQPRTCSKREGTKNTFLKSSRNNHLFKRKPIQALKLKSSSPQSSHDQRNHIENDSAESSDCDSSISQEPEPDFEKVLDILFGEEFSSSDFILMNSSKQKLNQKKEEPPINDRRVLSHVTVSAENSNFDSGTRTHSRKNTFFCKKCGARFKTKAPFYHHLRFGSHNKERLFVCKQCTARFKSMGGLNVHLRIHSRIFSCGECSAQFKTKREVAHHLKGHSEGRHFSCGQCSAQFKTMGEVTEHLTVHSEEILFSCGQCSAQFKTKGNLTQHLRVHSEERRFSCGECPAQFKTKGEASRHLRVHSEERRFSCGECPAQFKTKGEASEHLKVHSVEGRFSCGRCSAQFKSQWRRTEHLTVHSEVRHFSCGQCSAKFKTKRAAAQHLRVHSNERPFSCKQCSARFKFMHHLNAHLRIHSNERPFSCEQCSAQFKSKREIKQHLDSHIRPIVCQQCPAQFGYSISLKRHIMLKHSGETFSRPDIVQNGLN